MLYNIRCVRLMYFWYIDKLVSNNMGLVRTSFESLSIKSIIFIFFALPLLLFQSS